MLEDPPLLTIAKDHERRPSAAQIAGFQGVPTSFVADSMGGGGALARDIRPLGEGQDLATGFAGPALTVDSGPADVLALLAAPDFVSEGDVVVAAFGGHQGCAAAGDRVTGALRQAGAIGLVTDGPVRDYEGIVEVGLPVFCTGLTPASPYSSGPGTIGGPVLIGGQRVETGDMIVADRTGVVVVPHEMLDTVLDALEKIKVMEEVRDRAVAEGVLVPANVRKILDGPRTRRLS